MNALPEPANTISPKIISVWRISNTIGHATAVILFGILLFCRQTFEWVTWLDPVFYSLIGITVLSSIYSIFIEPRIVQRTWRYSIDEEFIQLKHGKITVHHTIIPMNNVQYVSTNQGPLLRKQHLYTLSIGTTTSSHTIPALPVNEAIALREQIARLANVEEDAQKGETA